MGGLSHARIVTMIGVVTAGEPAMLVEEFMANGNLHTFMRHAVPLLCAGKPAVTAQRMLQFAADIAEGMAYVAQRGIVHRVSVF